jgi:class 3 adenylate cyclase/tetratricopeptide (TPR) repeat protein
MVCPRCGEANVTGAKFCVECGMALSSSCPTCGGSTDPRQKFCSECGTPVVATESTAAQPPRTAGPPQAASNGEPRRPAELRTVSVLFVDLVAYTSLSEAWDAEELREFLGRYFDRARTIVNRYGGTIEKFIGDAVMAVWGSPVAREDDAERAVRAGLEIVDAVTALGQSVGAPDLRARAGVVTGQAASLVNADEGLVVGDKVNTASRVQTIADPGTVLVDEVTRLVTAAIDYEDVGRHQVKGKAEPLRLWRARGVVARAGGADHHEGLHATFVGREADLRLIKDLFHSGVDRHSTHLVAVSGPAGVGKSRLRWEFFKYLEGLDETVLWHAGRSLPYGEGVAYWALAEMVRQRLKIPEDAAPDETQSKLTAGLELWIDEPSERELLFGRLGVLLGVAEPGASREELFAGWRLFFERLAEHDPVVMVFEDMHWADDGVLDFTEYLLDWSAQYRIFVLTLARPELSERRPGWLAGGRGATSLYLEPLRPAAMEQLLDSLATLPADTKQKIISHAEGIPLYAIETVRTLADRGVLTERDGALVLDGELGELDVPPGLISLLGARIDALAPEERALVKAMSVFGGSFPRAAAQALGVSDTHNLEVVLTRLVRNQVLTVHADPLSPDRGQYAFAQTMLRTVAYDMVSKRERKSLHLAVARYLRDAFSGEGEDVAEVIAAHYLDAYRCSVGDPDARELRREAVAALRRGAGRAAALGAPQAAERTYRTAIDLAEDEDERIGLMQAAGQMALVDGRHEAALECFEAAAAALQALGRHSDAARLAAKTGEALRRLGRASEAIDRMRRALAVLGSDAEDVDVAETSIELGVALLYTGSVAEASGPIEQALTIAQALELESVLATALTYKAVLCDIVGRIHEARILFDGAIELCNRNELSDPLFRAQLNSSDLLARFDLPGTEERTRDALATARRIGSRLYESLAASNLMRVCEYTGSWADLERLGAELLSGEAQERPGGEYIRLQLAILDVYRGQTAQAREHLSILGSFRDSEENELRWTYGSCEALVEMALGNSAEAFDTLSRTIHEAVAVEGPAGQATRIAFPAGIEAAVDLSQFDEAADLLSLLASRPLGHVPPYLRAQLARGRGLLAARRGDHALAEGEFRMALEQLRSLGYPYWVARVGLDYGASLIDDQRAPQASAVIDDAMAQLKVLGALPALRRAERLRADVDITARA